MLRKAARAARAREALKQSTTGLVSLVEAAAPNSLWATPEHAAAASVQVFKPTLSSTAAAARFLKVSRPWLQRLNVVAASSLLKAEWEGHLLHEVELAKDRALITPISFVWSRMYDETPARSWTHVVNSAGELQGQATIAKVMACMLDFAFVFAAAPDQHGEPLPAQQQRGPPTSPAHSRGDPEQALHMIRGSLGTQLVALSSQHGEVVLEAIQRSMSMTPEHQALVNKLFPARVVVRQTDMHRSQIAAERELSRQAPGWASALFRCGMHRARTGELHTLGLDAKTESFFLNYTLMLRQQPDAQRSFRERVEQWAAAKLKVYHGQPAKEVLDWRKAMEQTLFPEGPADPRAETGALMDSRSQAARKFCWDFLTNGDCRVQTELQHYCAGKSCCPEGRPQTLQRMLGKQGLPALLHPAPPLFPRRSWHGQRRCMAHVIQQEATHGLLSQNFRGVAYTAKMKAEKAVEQRAKELRRAAPSALEEFGAQASAGLATSQAQTAAEMAEQNAERCKDILEFLLSDGLAAMIRLTLLIDAFQNLKATILSRNASTWHIQQMAGAAAGGHRAYPLQEATGGRYLRAHLSTCAPVFPGSNCNIRSCSGFCIPLEPHAHYTLIVGMLNWPCQRRRKRP